MEIQVNLLQTFNILDHRLLKLINLLIDVINYLYTII